MDPIAERKNREAWGKRFQETARLFRAFARDENGKALDNYHEIQARRYYRQARQIMKIEEGELN